MERLTRPAVKVDETAAQYMAATGSIPVDLRSMNDRLLDLVINGPTLNGVNKDVLRQLIRQLYAALMPYEDTGLEPEKVEIMRETKADAQFMLTELCRLCDYDRLEELAKADKEGRLVVLPCKAGDTVYILGHRFAAQIDEIVMDVDNGVTFNWSEYDRGPEETELWDEGWFTLDDIDKTVFLTREEAERALEGGTKNE